MQARPAITLRYFACRGRAQPLRYALHDAGVTYDDELVPFDASWVECKQDPSFSGPFASLPVLVWGDVVLAQTPAIAYFLARTLELGGDGSDLAMARALALCTFGLEDFAAPIFGVLWQPGEYSAESVRAARDGARARLASRVTRLEAWLQDNAPYALGERPCIGDYFLWEGVDVAIRVIGPSLIEAAPAVRAWFDRMAARPRLAAYIASGARPAKLCGSMVEDEILALLAE